jgi:NADPH-dependent 7-cyano-7-deazaguanine reductase QueF-like protein
VFYSIELLPAAGQWISALNPVLYMVNTFRYGILGSSDVNIYWALFILVLFGAVFIRQRADIITPRHRVAPMMTMKNIPLGQATDYPEVYDASVLYSVARSLNRASLNISEAALPFRGFDHWRAYELSWLLPGGMPVVATGDVLVPCDSTNIVESKSMKLYFNSLKPAHICQYRSGPVLYGGGFISRCWRHCQCQTAIA